jgi:hypothetical protein
VIGVAVKANVSAFVTFIQYVRDSADIIIMRNEEKGIKAGL